MTRFTYSPTGALKWKKDVSEYAEVLASYGVPAADEDMSYMQQVRCSCCCCQAVGLRCIGNPCHKRNTYFLPYVAKALGMLFSI
jgi:hypothetical protein